MWASGFTVDDLARVLLLSTVVVLAAVAAMRLSSRSGLPSLVLFLLLGLAVGDGGLGVRFSDAGLTQVLGYAALILILAEGGLTTSWHSMRPGVGAALSLSTVGVVVSVAIVAVAGRVLLRWDWPTALLVGAVLASTDAAAVFSVLRSVPLKPSLRGILEAESGFNDAPVVILVVTISHQIASPEPSEPWWQLLALVVVELVLGGLVGLAVGWVGARLVEWAATSGALFAIGVLTVCVLAYAAAASIGASGFLATYACAVVLGNSGLPNRAAVLGFATSVGSLAQIGLFVLIGLLASPARLGQQVIPALVVGAVLLLVARPLSVIVSVGPFRLPWRHQAFLSWAGLRGAVPIVLATVPVTLGSGAWYWMFDLVLVLVLVLTLVQAPTLPAAARQLKVTDTMYARQVVLEAVALEEVGAEVLQVSVAKGSRLAGLEIVELRLPKGSVVALLVRDGERQVPTRFSRIRTGDSLLVVTPASQRRAVEARLAAVSERGRLAGWT